MVRMADVAREAGVSAMTVSNVLNQRRPVAAATRARVLAAAESLGYEVNLTARHLSAGRTDTVALIVPSFHDYFGEVADEIAPLIEAEGRHLVLERTSASPEQEMESLSIARLQLYDGVLLSVASLDRQQLERVRTSKPIVLLGERDAPDRFDHVRLANEEGARLATAHMIERGSRRIVALGCTLERGHTMNSDRRVGWELAHEQAGLPVDERLVVPIATYSSQAARAALEGAIAAGLEFDAVFAATDVIALGAVAALADHRLRVPEDVQLAGFDNLDVSRFVPPGITSIDPNHQGVAQHAVRLLHRRMADGAAPAEHIVVPVDLVVRGSTRP
ncbi:transcriptional regulator, LacI family [Xylanimonas cellulosilytica DSM 15894]|uniref:Transcriptional regulator, LacI family n=1 Tax=Xylanimonas cellulosilytica (strain DSM 15894 / JCM 12276 / CECT 5975 / KCTC 9989 / LMG 20990 / NBRC 107835 / XIL07) TaxID=446471 RepID=D1BYC5_XYLCX|nr:LacI family DNA-binding transcriptional regulator [Xylanimonas cellulosilytica]ACZ31797.1 transcriptional regulator, LacI family [Xylanimonas cellulosilytica DSM 15894]